jgi:hypothetical protein
MANLFQSLLANRFVSISAGASETILRQDDRNACMYANEASQSKPANMPTCRHESATPISNV